MSSLEYCDLQSDDSDGDLKSPPSNAVPFPFDDNAPCSLISFHSCAFILMSYLPYPHQIFSLVFHNVYLLCKLLINLIPRKQIFGMFLIDLFGKYSSQYNIVMFGMLNRFSGICKSSIYGY